MEPSLWACPRIKNELGWGGGGEPLLEFLLTVDQRKAHFKVTPALVDSYPVEKYMNSDR